MMFVTTRAILFVGALCCVHASVALCQTPGGNDTRDARVSELIQKLGSTSFVQREHARKELEAMGPTTLDSLRRASKPSDMETRLRIADLIHHFEEQLLTRQVLTPKQIHLKLANVSVPDAIAELSKASGYTVHLLETKDYADKKIDLDTGNTSFWQALDQLCERAGLMEKIDPPSQQAGAIPYRVGRKGVRQLELGAVAPTAERISLIPRTDETLSVSYAGAVKTQLRAVRDAKTNDLVLTAIISVEPQLHNSTLVSRPRVETAIDQAIQKLTTIAEEEKTDASADGEVAGLDLVPASVRLRRHARIRIKDEEVEVSKLKELTGTLSLKVDRANDLIAKVPKILDASGKAVAGANGGTLKVSSVRKVGDDFEVQVTMQNLTPNPLGGSIGIFGGNVVIRGNVMVQNMIVGPGGIRGGGTSGNVRDLPDLLDAKGQKYQIANVTSDGINIFNGAFTRTATVIYRANLEQAAPSELVLQGTRTYTITVPFRFENVTLP